MHSNSFKINNNFSKNFNNNFKTKRSISFLSVSPDHILHLYDFVHFIFLQSEHNIIEESRMVLAPAKEIQRFLAMEFPHPGPI